MRNQPEGIVQQDADQDSIKGFRCNRGFYEDIIPAGYVSSETRLGASSSAALLAGATLCYQTVKQTVRPSSIDTAFSKAFSSAFK